MNIAANIVLAAPNVSAQTTGPLTLFARSAKISVAAVRCINSWMFGELVRRQAGEGADASVIRVILLRKLRRKNNFMNIAANIGPFALNVSG